MKNKLICILFLGSLFAACKKDPPVAATQVIRGTLSYSSPIADGAGLIYITDTGENLLFKNKFSDLNTQYEYYKNLVGIHSRLTYRDTGEKGCTQGMLPCNLQTPLRIVEVVNLYKE